MIREIVHYDAPVLRAKGKEVGAITPEIRKLIEDLFDTCLLYTSPSPRD